MGNIEKLVVLTVLFLSAIVLAVSLSEDGGEVQAANPLGAAQDRLRDEGATPPAARSEEPQGTGGPQTGPVTAGPAAKSPGLLLNSEVESDAAQAPDPASTTPAEPADGPPRILRDERGLTPSGLEDYRIYRVAEGDTWSGLSQRFYAGRGYVEQLRSANEELEGLIAGEQILVPVFDFAHEAGRREPFEPARRAAAPEAGTVYVVQDGDNLSKISKAVFGTPNRWEEIYAANRDALESADWLTVGMKLAIPPAK